MGGEVQESLDYDIVENSLYRRERYTETRGERSRKGIMRWWVVLWVGFLSAMAAVIIDYMASDVIVHYKLKLFHYLLEQCNCKWLPFLVYIGINAGLCAIAATMAFIEPASAGSGIPEVKCYLNGLKLPHILRFKTLICKMVGVICGVGASLAIGPEGPMIHSGAIIGAGVSQGKTSTFNIDTQALKKLRNDVEKRDFVGCGAAAGIAAGFGAPVGGLLFSLEEGNSFWNIALVWRTFFSTIVAAFTFRFFMSGAGGAPWGHINEALYQFPFVAGEMPGYSVGQIAIFILVGIMGGLLGALFCHIAHHLISLRMKLLTSPYLKWLEVIMVSVVTSSATLLWCSLVLVFDSCKPITQPIPDNIVIFFCPEGTYNDMATLLISEQQDTIEMLFQASEFGRATLCFLFILYYFLTVYALGTAIPAGTFVPLIITGCAFGRFMGDVIQDLFPDLNIYPGTIALIGAAALLAGIMRMTISLTVILIESTNDITYGFPIMLAVIVAKFVADFFSEGIYEILLELKHRPILMLDPPPYMRKFKAKDIMSTPVICFREVESVDSIYTKLSDNTHNGFPVLDEENLLTGIILRHQLITLLMKPSVFQEDTMPTKRPARDISQQDFQDNYPRYPHISTIMIEKQDKEKHVDLTPYMNPCPYTVHEQSPLTRVFRLFRLMGLRHVIAVDHFNHVVGMITRLDLAHSEHKLQHRCEDH